MNQITVTGFFVELLNTFMEFLVDFSHSQDQTGSDSISVGLNSFLDVEYSQFSFFLELVDSSLNNFENGVELTSRNFEGLNLQFKLVDD